MSKGNKKEYKKVTAATKSKKKKRIRLNTADPDYFAKLRYGYLTVLVAVLNFIVVLMLSFFLSRHSSVYFKLLMIYMSWLHGFVRTCLIILISVAPLWLCHLYARVKPIKSIFFFGLALITIGFPLGIPVILMPTVIIPVALQVLALTVLFCSIGIVIQKDLSNWNSILSMSLLGLVLSTFVNLQFLHLPLVTSILSYATMTIFLGYLIFDANEAMNSYAEAKKLGGLFFISILLSNSLDILQDIIVLFFELLSSEDSDSDNDSGGFDSFW